MTRLGIVGDIHLSVTPPGRRTDTYLADVQAKLTEIAQAEDVDAWLLIGDLFHHKRANRVPHSLVAWVWDWITTLHTPEFGTASVTPRPVFIVPGNHDLADGSIESIERQPLGVLERHLGVSILRGVRTDPGYPEGGYYPVVMPYCGGLLAVPGTGDICDARADATELFHHDDADWVVAHAPISTRELPWATYDAATLPLAPQTKGVIYGHQHDEAGCWARPDGKLVIATGAISRGSVTEASHTPSWLVLDARTGAVDVRPIACARPAADIYRWAERTEERVADETVAAFIDALDSEALAGFSREALTDTIAKRTDLDPAVRNEAVAILTELA